MARGAAMKDAVERYLRLRRSTGFALSNDECLLASFARFAGARNEAHIRAQTAIDWAAEGPSAAQRDARLKAVCRFARHVRAEDDRHELPPARYILDAAKSAAPRTSTRKERSTASLRPQLNSPRAAHCGLTLTRLCLHCWQARGCESPRRWACDLPTSQLMGC
jgi:hypothetical protein